MENSLLTDIKLWITVILSTFAGMTIAWIDSRPGWDDTGITAAMLFIASGLAGYFYPKKPWLWAILSGIWIPVVGIMRRGDVLMLIVLIITFGGAYSGSLIRKMVKGAKT